MDETRYLRMYPNITPENRQQENKDLYYDVLITKINSKSSAYHMAGRKNRSFCFYTKDGNTFEHFFCNTLIKEEMPPMEEVTAIIMDEDELSLNLYDDEEWRTHINFYENEKNTIKIYVTPNSSTYWICQAAHAAKQDFLNDSIKEIQFDQLPLWKESANNVK